MNDKTPESVVSESTEYENFMEEMKEEKPAPAENTLEAVFGEIPDVESSHPNHYQKHWKGMPEYKNDTNNNKYKTVYVHFRTKEDFEDFCQKIDQYPAAETKNNTSIWHPKLDRTANSLLRWIEDDD